MDPTGIESYISADWPSWACRFDYRLSRESPLCADTNSYVHARGGFYEVHAGFEVGIVLSGRQQRLVADQAFSAGPGDVWLGAPWELHGMQVLAPDTRIVVFIFLAEYLGDETLGDIPWLNMFACPPGQRPRMRDEKARARTLLLADRLWEELGEREEGWATTVRFDLLQVLWTLRRGWVPPEEVSSRAGASNLARLVPLLDVLREEPSHPLSVAEAADLCKLSQTHFRRIFQKTMGLTFGNFCRHARLALAAHKLATTDLALQDIAFQTGFLDGSHLHHSFTQRYGCTPGSYREQTR